MAKLTDDTPGTGNFGRDLQPGEERAWPAKDKQGNVLKMIKLTRTARDYVHDLCDAYNDARTADAKERGVEWFVANGELRIGDSADWSRFNRRQTESRNETERARFIRYQLEHMQPPEPVE